jgi:hypothetical protein
MSEEEIEKPKRGRKPKEEIPKVDKATSLLKEIAELEDKAKAKKKEYSEYIASQRKEAKKPSLHECLQLAMRDDLNSDRRELKKVTGMALSKLKKSK